MAEFTPRDPQFEQKVRESFARQGIMDTLGARLGRVEPGLVEILVDHHKGLTQQHGFFHAGVTSTLADSAGGYAGYSLFPAGSSVLTVEFKVNLLAPADGQTLRTVGRVIKPGRTLTICDIEAYVIKDGKEKLCAKMQQTLMCMHDRPDEPTT
ncbi:PaaI family thioesterase [Rhodovibrionaceae bacterium A322]